jgi:hypothetical protein
LGRMRADLPVPGVHGMRAQEGFMPPNMLEAKTGPAFIKAATWQISVPDQPTWAVAGRHQIVPPALVDALIPGHRLE